MILEQVIQGTAQRSGSLLAASVDRLRVFVSSFLYWLPRIMLPRIILKAIVLVSPVAVVISINLFAPARASAFDPILRFTHVTILTNNLDSSTRSFQKRGYAITWGNRRGLLQSNYICFADSSFIELQCTYARDTLDWRVQQIREFGTHVSALAFQTRSMDSAIGLLEGAGVVESKYGRALGVGGYPVDLTISDQPAPLPKERITTHPNGAYKMDWVLLAADDSTEKEIIGVFRKLGIPESHEGCCNYWMFGPPERRTSLRFDKLYSTRPPTGAYLMIELGGLNVGYH